MDEFITIFSLACMNQMVDLALTLVESECNILSFLSFVVKIFSVL